MKKIIILIFILLFIVSCTTETINTKDSIIKSESNSGLIKVDLEQIDDFISVKLNSLELSDALIKNDYPTKYSQEGYLFLIIDLTVENIKFIDDLLEINGLELYYTEFTIKDSEYYSYEPDTSFGIKMNKMLSANINIPKGDITRGKLVYEVPVDSDIIELILKDNSAGSRINSVLKFDISEFYEEAKNKFVPISIDKEVDNNQNSLQIINEIADDLVNSPKVIVSEIIDNGDGTFTCEDGSKVNNIDVCFNFEFSYEEDLIDEQGLEEDESTIEEDEPEEIIKEAKIVEEKNNGASKNGCPIFSDLDMDELNPVMVTDHWDNENGLGHINMNVEIDDEGYAIMTNRWKDFVESLDIGDYEFDDIDYSCFAFKGKVGFNPNYNYCTNKIEKETYDDTGVLISKEKKKLVFVFERVEEFPRDSTSIGGKISSMTTWTAANIEFIKSYCMNVKVGVIP
jgi:hypothetical protein